MKPQATSQCSRRAQRLSLYYIAGLIALSPIVHAQDLHIRVVDARNGRPILHDSINIWFHENNEPITEPTQSHYSRQLLLPTDKDGNITVRVRPGENYVSFFTVNYVDCRRFQKTRGGLLIPLYPIAQIATSGLHTDSHCGKHTIAPKSGELVYFVRPWHWWERVLNPH